MNAEALPCLVCGAILLRDNDMWEIQPSDGVILQTHGNYGSTKYDPMNGNVLYMNLCDDCLVKAGEQGRVKAGKDYMLVQTDMPGDGRIFRSVVGTHQVERPLVQWDVSIPDDDEMEYVPIDELLADDYLDKETYHWNLRRAHFVAAKEEIDRQDEERERKLCGACDMPEENRRHSTPLFDGDHEFVAKKV